MVGVGLYLHALLTTSLDGGELLASRFGLFNPRKETRHQRVGGRVGRRACLDVVAKRDPVLPGIETWSSKPLSGHCTDRISTNVYS
jgi:hypothetical protein